MAITNVPMILKCYVPNHRSPIKSLLSHIKIMFCLFNQSRYQETITYHKMIKNRKHFDQEIRQTL